MTWVRLKVFAVYTFGQSEKRMIYFYFIKAGGGTPKLNDILVSSGF
jgi:hypothetical protein